MQLVEYIVERRGRDGKWRSMGKRPTIGLAIAHARDKATLAAPVRISKLVRRSLLTGTVSDLIRRFGAA